VISIETIIWFVVYLVVAGLVYWVLSWMLAEINPPEPFKKIGRVVLVLLVGLIVISLQLVLKSL